MNKVFCLGELLIDFISLDTGKSIKDSSKFEKKAGGAPANVTAAIAKLGGRASFLGQVGNDSFGDFLIETLKEVKVDTSKTKKAGSTTLAFVAIDDDGERDFEFIRGSDKDYSFENIDLKEITSKDIIHFGSATAFLNGNLEDAYFKLLDWANKNNVYTSFDPNYRDLLILDDKIEEFIKNCKYFIKNTNFTKMSLEELELITKTKDVNEGLDLLHQWGGEVVVITMGAQGSLLSFKDKRKMVNTIKVVQKDATGAGDAFVGAVLLKLSKLDNKENLSFDDWQEFVYYGNLVGAITCTDYGAIASMPSKGFEKKLK